MAKVMASIEEGVIINVSWWAEGTPETGYFDYYSYYCSLEG